MYEYVELVLKSARQDGSRHILHFPLRLVEKFRTLKSKFTVCLYFVKNKKTYYDMVKPMPYYYSEGSSLPENIFWKLFFSFAV